MPGTNLQALVSSADPMTTGHVALNWPLDFDTLPKSQIGAASFNRPLGGGRCFAWRPHLSPVQQRGSGRDGDLCAH